MIFNTEQEFQKWFDETYPDVTLGTFNYTDRDLLDCWRAAVMAIIVWQGQNIKPTIDDPSYFKHTDKE